ncbi:MAG: ribonuclease HI family protein [Patescibacteria group bacterium]
MSEELFQSSTLKIFTDGGSRGNPGPAGIGFIVGNKKYGETIGYATNNVAEYRAVVSALKKAKQLLGKIMAKKTDIDMRMDSELIVKQMNGKYKIQEPELQKYFMEIWNMRLDFKSVTFTHIPREQNKEADAMVNLALDGKIRADLESEGMF